MTRYDYEFDVKADSVAGRVVRLVGRDQRVLELGCSAGHMSRVFKDRGCQVVGVELDAQAANAARSWCEAVYVANLDDPDWVQLLKDEAPFDVVVAADVLEHLRDPRTCLAQLRRLLKSEGRIVLSTPNIAHGGVLAGLLQGQFNYRATGLLDSTHIHFFTQKSLCDALEAEGFVIEHLSPVEAGADHPEFINYWQSLPQELRLALEKTPDAKAFQWVASAAKMPNESHLVVLQEAQQQLEMCRRQLADFSLVKTQLSTLTDACKKAENLLKEERSNFALQSHMSQMRVEAQAKLAAQYSKRIDELEAQIGALLSSASWRVTSPIRIIAQTIRIGLELLRLLRRVPKNWLKKLYHSFPIHVRCQIKNFLFQEFSWVFRRSTAYKEWSSWRGMQISETTHELQQAREAMLHYLDDGKSLHENQIYQTHLKTDALRLVAFYLPQFHPIPENDEWWGRGFTEWTNVSKAQPQFADHYQPHLPGELGFYDLRIPDIMRRQVELAKTAGLAGFCFHYYWFGGRRLLERPLETYIADSSIDFPFCICWANENWSRRWDGMESDVLMQQVHTPETDEAFIRDVTPVLMDPRYIRVDGKPLLIVYRVSLLPDARATVKRWREYFSAHGLGEIYLVAAQSFDVRDPRPYGFDAAVEFPPHGVSLETINQAVKINNPNYTGRVYDYRDLVDHFSGVWADDYVLHKTVVPSWDNEARKPGRGNSFINSTPDAYANWLKQVSKETVQRYPDEQRLVFVNAWNEWAEGAHLEPDRRYGYAWLNRTREVLEKYAPASIHASALAECHRKSDVAVILHMYYPELFVEVASRLAPVAGSIDLYVSVKDGALEYCTEIIHKIFPDAVVVSYPNIGRDVCPFLNIYKHISTFGYKAVCKLHSKKSMHRQDGALWRQDIYDKLIGSPEIIEQCVRSLTENADVGVIGPAGHILDSSQYWAMNKKRVTELSLIMGCSSEHIEQFFFVAGTMFWFRPEALTPLVELNLNMSDFDPEEGQVDGTLAHAVERLIGLACVKSGFGLYEVEKGGVVSKAGLNYAVDGNYVYAAKTGG